jgi:hypothetical protein
MNAEATRCQDITDAQLDAIRALPPADRLAALAELLPTGGCPECCATVTPADLIRFADPVDWSCSCGGCSCGFDCTCG